MSISLKDHRFNRLMDCSLALLYHFDDVASYLDKFTSISNGITVLDRSFLDMDILNGSWYIYVLNFCSSSPF